ncbi:MAG: PAS domain S-box protein, partial [Burkholderiales bacterium]
MDKSHPIDMNTTYSPEFSTQYLAKRYIVTLSVIASLTLLGHLLVQWALDQQSQDAHIITIAEKQRLLSENLSKTALIIQLTQDDDKRLYYVEKFRHGLDFWERFHIGLQWGDQDMGLSGDNSITIINMFANLQIRYLAMDTAAKNLLAVFEESSLLYKDLSPLVNQIIAEESAFLQEMEAIVSQYKLEANSRLERLKQMDFILASLTLLMLLIEGLYIFYPALQNIQRIHQELTVTKKISQKKQTWLQIILDHAPLAIFIKDIQDHYLLTNHYFENLIGFGEEELRNKTDHDLFEASLANHLHNNDLKVCQTKTLQKFEEVIPSKTALHTYHSIKFPLFDKDEKVYAICSLSTDITEQKRAEDTLKESKELFRILLGINSKGLVLINSQKIVLAANHQAALLLTTHLEQLVGNCIYQFLAPTLITLYKNHFEEVAALAQPRYFKYDLQPYVLSCALYPIYASNKISTKILIVQEIHAPKDRSSLTQQPSQTLFPYSPQTLEFYLSLEQNRPFSFPTPSAETNGSKAVSPITISSAELHIANTAAHMVQPTQSETQVVPEMNEAVLKKLLQQNSLLSQRLQTCTTELTMMKAELLRSTRLKNEFLSNITHELRTPLSNILSLSEALHDEIYGGLSLNPEQIQVLCTIEENGRQLLGLIDSILDLAKVEAGKFKLEISPISFHSTLGTCLRFVRHLAERKDLQLLTQVDENISTFASDPRCLKQILCNLLNNAVKFTPPQGKVTLNIFPDRDHSVIYLQVSDTGIGISQADMARLFKPFGQLDGRLAREQGGTGVGLSLIYRLSEIHGGSITLESEVGQGSCFTVCLPWEKGTIPTSSAS